jgi:ComF family protein
VNAWRAFLNFILPPRCAVCGKILHEEQGFCERCISQIDFIRPPVCYRCGHPLDGNAEQRGKHWLCGSCLQQKHPLFRFSRSAYAYDDFSKKLILDFKFYDKTDLAALLAKFLYVAGADIWQAGVDVIIPVPLHYTRLLKRRYNQSALMAKELGRLCGIDVAYDVLVKVKKTRPQVACSGSERLHNLHQAFAVKNTEKIRGKRILLVDDVLTTGTTMKECASVLRRAKPKSIDNITVARVL